MPILHESPLSATSLALMTVIVLAGFAGWAASIYFSGKENKS